MTFDVDLMVTKEHLKAIENDLVTSGYTVCNRQDGFLQFETTNLGYKDLDFIIVDEFTIQTIIESGKKTTIAGETFYVPSPLHLIAMKLHAISQNKVRVLKDFPDIVQLVQQNAIDPKEAAIERLFQS